MRSAKSEEEKCGKSRFQAINREQLCWRIVNVERLIPEEHPARAIWELVGKLDLRGYTVQMRALKGEAGRPSLNPQNVRKNLRIALD